MTGNEYRRELMKSNAHAELTVGCGCSGLELAILTCVLGLAIIGLVLA